MPGATGEWRCLIPERCEPACCWRSRPPAHSPGQRKRSAAFLDCTQPDLAASVARLVERGAMRIVVVPYFLTLGAYAEQAVVPALMAH